MASSQFLQEPDYSPERQALNQSAAQVPDREPGDQSFLPDTPTEAPQNQPVGWQGNRPEHLPEGPEFMPGPTDWEVTPEQTVQGQMEGILDRDSSLNQMMRERFRTEMARSGRQNSLMADTAAEGLVAQMAFQIASQDAATFARSAEFNAMARNQFSMAELQFMQQAMLNEQNFNHATLLQREQIAGQLSAIAAQGANQLAAISAQGDVQANLMNLGQEHWLQQNELLHGQNLENMMLNQDFNLETMAFGTELDMIRAGWAADLQMAMSDQAFRQDLIRMEQDYSWRQALQYQSEVAGMLAFESQALAAVGSAGLEPAQTQAAFNQIQSQITASINLIAQFFGSNGGPMAQWNNQPHQNYNYFGPPPSLGGPGQVEQPGGG